MSKTEKGKATQVALLLKCIQCKLLDEAHLYQHMAPSAGSGLETGNIALPFLMLIGPHQNTGDHILIYWHRLIKSKGQQPSD